VLLDALPPGTVRFNTGVAGVSSRSSSPRTQGGAAPSQWPLVQLDSGGQVEAAMVVAADGARSKIASSVLGVPLPTYAGYTAYR
jgi:2-polyprenyl-6-methoxyphenol hydroxylase-like FAD-dependent oxidoreductase